MKYVDLDRRFTNLSESGDIDPELWAAVSGADGRLNWDRLLQRKRVVILAEAGSGKSTELTEQSRRWKAAGHVAFAAKLQVVGRRGLIASLGARAREELAAWQTTNAPAWFFIDSVDEAKLDNVRLDDALREIADVLDPYLGRAHIVLSGRHTDWEFRRDLERLEEILPVPVEQPLEVLSDQERLDQVIHNRAPKRKALDVKHERPLVVVMAPLNEAQVRLFAGAAGVTDIDAFHQALKQADLLEFAKRPLDLEWLTQTWKRDRQFGTFARMLEQAIAERSKESDPMRAQQAPLDGDHVRRALRRIGAALVLARGKAIAIPDTAVGAEAEENALDLQSVLPDWQAPDIQRLARLPAFDPGTPGRARLHNDNEGVVSGFLAAEWMRDVRANNCPIQAIFDLLFADVYGHAFVRPSMREAAAWLSLWNDDVANEVIKRDPHVLLNFGDPGSLPKGVKERALEQYISALVADESERHQYDFDALRRFARADLDEAVRKAWVAHGDRPAIRVLLLQLIWLGEIKACADLALGAVYDAAASRRVMLFGGRALLATASDADKALYAAYVTRDATRLRTTAVWDAVDALFPAPLTVSDFIAILGAVDVADAYDAGGLETNGAEWARRLSKSEELIALIEALDAKLTRPYGDLHATDSNEDRHYLPMMVAAGRRLLDVVRADEAPDAAVDALLRVADADRGRDSDESDRAAIAIAVHQNKGRRRAAFWRAAFRLKDAKYLSDGLDTVWKMQHFGYDPGLQIEDIEWLLSDAPQRRDEAERALGIDAAMWVWRATGQDNALLERVRTVASAEPRMASVIDAWTVERAPSPELIASERRHEKLMREREQQRAEVSKSWQQFVDDLRSDPDQLRQLRPVTNDTIDRRLHDVWQLLNSADRGRSRYAFETADALKSLLGPDVVTAFTDAMIGFWRQWTPNVRSGRAAEERDKSYSFDSMGIAGVAMEAHRSSAWPSALTEADALRAAQYATLELNGFPPYLARLADRFPLSVRDALMTEIRSELDTGVERGRTLGSIAYAGEAIARVLAEDLETELRTRPGISARNLNELLPALIPVVAPDRRDAVTTLLLERFHRGAPRDEQIEYLGAAFELDSQRAAAAMLAEAEKMQQPERSAFLQQTMAVYFGRSHTRRRGTAEAPFEMLEELIRAAYGAIDPAHDVVHQGVYTPDLRDDAESARGRLLEMLIKTPGRATYETLRRLNDDPHFNSRPGRFEELAIGRAAEDAEHAPWAAVAVVHFETAFDDTPRVGVDLQLLARRRLEDIEHKLMHGDFAQASTLRLLGDERAVQNFIAERLRDAQGRAYSVEREPHVADENEPDIRLRARATDASVAIEIKDMNSPWSLADYEAALRDQLCGKYLRDKGHRHGVLLLVHRERRPRGWVAPDGTYWSLDQLVAHLRTLAAQIAATGPDAPVAEIVVIDVAE